MQITITLPDSFPVSSRGQTIHVPLTKLSADIIARGAVHGLTQRIADAASGAKKDAIAELGKDAAMTDIDAKASELSLPMMAKALDALLAGEWAVRGSAEAVGEEVKIARTIMRNLFKDGVGAKSAAWAEFTGLSDADQIAKLDALCEKNAKILAPAVEEELARRAAIRKAKEGLQAKVAFEI